MDNDIVNEQPIDGSKNSTVHESDDVLLQSVDNDNVNEQLAESSV